MALRELNNQKKADSYIELHQFLLRESESRGRNISYFHCFRNLRLQFGSVIILIEILQYIYKFCWYFHISWSSILGVRAGNSFFKIVRASKINEDVLSESTFS